VGKNTYTTESNCGQKNTQGKQGERNTQGINMDEKFENGGFQHMPRSTLHRDKGPTHFHRTEADAGRHFSRIEGGTPRHFHHTSAARSERFVRQNLDAWIIENFGQFWHQDSRAIREIEEILKEAVLRRVTEGRQINFDSISRHGANREEIMPGFTVQDYFGNRDHHLRYPYWPTIREPGGIRGTSTKEISRMETKTDGQI
jgi:hypothetical protein